MITARRVMSAIDDVLAEMGMLQHRHKRHVAAASAMTATSSDLDF
jgi:hypothetical protein